LEYIYFLIDSWNTLNFISIVIHKLCPLFRLLKHGCMMKISDRPTACLNLNFNLALICVKFVYRKARRWIQNLHSISIQWLFYIYSRSLSNAIFNQKMNWLCFFLSFILCTFQPSIIFLKYNFTRSEINAFYNIIPETLQALNNAYSLGIWIVQIYHWLTKS